MTEAAIFMSGNSQAVRLPKSFRFNGKSVEIFRRGNEVVLREKRQTVAEVLKDLPPISKEDAEAFEQAMRSAGSAQERDWDQLLGSSARP
jgi:antitoxin VapB